MNIECEVMTTPIEKHQSRVKGEGYVRQVGEWGLGAGDNTGWPGKASLISKPEGDAGVEQVGVWRKTSDRVNTMQRHRHRVCLMCL